MPFSNIVQTESESASDCVDKVVDIFKDNDGKWALAELEIFEPELWFRNRPEAALILAEIIKSKVTYEEVS